MKKKYAILFVLLLSLVLPVATQGTETIQNTEIINPDNEAYYVNYLSEEFFANYHRAVAYHIEIYNAFPVNSNRHTMFPSYYGGHLVDDNGNLVMNIVVSYGRDGVLSPVISETLNSPYVIMRLVSFSYNELQDTMVFLTDFWHANPDCKIRNASVSFALCIINNHVEVSLYGYSEELKEAFRTYVLDSPMIVFMEGWPSEPWARERVSEPTGVVINSDVNPLNTPVNVFPGDRIYVRLPPYYRDRYEGFSAGYGVMWGSTRGFVTAPHDTMENQYLSWASLFHLQRGDQGDQGGTFISQFTSNIVYRDGVDAGFARMVGNHQFINQVDGRTIVPGFIPPYIGQVLSTVGASFAYERNIQPGIQRNIQVTHLNYSRQGLENLVKTNGWGYEGDSGGLVFIPDPGGVTGTALAVGLMVASDPEQGFPIPFLNMVFSRADLINSELGVTIPTPLPSPLQVRFHFDNQTVTLPVTNNRIDQSQVPIPATRYGRPGIPGQAHMGWFTQIVPNMHNVNHPNRRTPVNLASNFTNSMADANNIINLHASWLQYGDIDGDGIINGIDRTLLQNINLGAIPITAINRETADVNVDAIIDTIDRALLQNHILGVPVILGPINPNMPRTTYIVSFHFENGITDLPITNGRIDTTLITEAELLAWEMELLNALYTASRRGGATGLTMYVTDLINTETSVLEFDLSAMVTSTADILYEMRVLEEEMRMLSAIAY